MIEVDGAAGEGGGQIVRTALALSAVTGQPCRVVRIREGRENPGLRPQHAAVARAFAQVTGGKVEGAEVGSRALTFEPGAARGGELRVDIGTAGSIPLFLQALLPALARGQGSWRVEVQGGSDGKWAPPWDYFARVHVDTLERLGWRPRVKLVRRGWYPRGGGSAVLEAGPWEPRPFRLARSGSAFQVLGRLAVSNLPEHVPARIRGAALARLAQAGFQAEVDVAARPALDPGCALVLRADDGRCLLGAASLGEPGKSSEEVGREAAEALLGELGSGASVDAHASDQLLVYAALAAEQGPSSYTAREATPHARTNAAVIEEFLPVRVRFEPEGGLTRVEVEAA